MPSDEQKQTNLAAMEAMLKATMGATGKCSLNDVYSLAKVAPIEGAWYFSVKCEECRSLSPALRDESNGERGNPFQDDGGAIRLNCHQCGNEVQAKADEIFPRQHFDLVH